MEESKKRQVMGLVTNLLQDPHIPTTFASLSDASYFYRVLALASPAFFPDEDSLKDTEDNWVIKKSNAQTLYNAMNAFAIQGLSAASDFAVNALVDVAVYAKGSDEATIQLAELVVTFAILSGKQEVKAAVQKLAAEDQKGLSGTIKRVMALNSLKPFNKNAQPGVAPPPPAVPAAADTAVANAQNVNVLHDMVAQLRRELSEKASTIATLEGRLEHAETDQREINAKYRSLLADHETQQTTSASEKELYQQIGKKDDVIRDLRGSLDDTASKMSQFKQRCATVEDEKEKMSALLNQYKTQLKEKTDEKYEISQRMSMLQDKADGSMKLRIQLNDENEALRSENAILRAQAGARDDTDSFVTNDDNDNASDLHEELLAARAKISTLGMELRMLKKSGFTPAESGAVLAATLDNSQNVSAALLDASVVSSGPRIAALEEELSRERSTTAAVTKERDSQLQHLQLALSELEDHRESITSSNAAIAGLKKQLAECGAPGLAKQNEELVKAHTALQAHVAERRVAMKKEQAVLLSTMVRYGHRNLLLQQRELLGPAAQPAPSSEGVGLVAGLFSLGSGQQQDGTEITGSFLTKHRKVFERALLDSVCSAGPSTLRKR